jgi:hypothetical protein
MRKHFNFAITAAIVGLAMVFWVKAGVVETNADVARPAIDLSSPMLSPYLMFRVLDATY